jgi:hypothetical protein
MKKILFIIAILISSGCMAQSYKVGKVDADGKLTLTADANKCRTILNQCSSKQNTLPLQANDFSFTRLHRGQICLTGYEKDASGKIIRGVRIQCTQDDENNLIIVKNNFTENITGKTFDATSDQNN